MLHLLVKLTLKNKLTKLDRPLNMSLLCISINLMVFIVFIIDGESKGFASKYDEFTNEYKGIFRIASCDCEEAEKICQKESVTKYPTVRVYPPYPVPAVDFEGSLSVDGILKLASKYIHNNIIEINEANINTFINENPTVPKAVLFSEKKGFPLVFKGLSVEFEVLIF